MAIIPQLKLFEWNEIQTLGDLERLRLVLEYMPDEEWMVALERKRGKGRDDYPVRAMWNSVLAGIVFQHDSVEKLRRELSRNGQLREMCGFGDKVPPSWVYTRFMKSLMEQEPLIEEIFDRLVQQIGEVLHDFGKHLAMDSKAISSFAKRKNRNEERDGRRDMDADYGRKEYRGVDENGKPWEKIVKWFGYKLHLVVDATYELPVAFKVTKASASDMTEGHALLDQMQERQPEIVKTAETLAADRGYDDTKLLVKLWDDHHIKPVIDIRNMWRDPDKTRLLEGRENVVYDYKGTVSCVCPETGKQREMCNGGFEKDRNTLKKLCPVKQMGITCEGQAQCPVAQGIRIPLSEDRRIFTPIDRASYKWEKEYDKRTAVERVNSRLDVSFGFEMHTIRGIAKMKMRCGLALCVMLAMALGRIKEKQGEKMRSLVA
ncbi:transposase [Microaerobacter geothermalis]|uniref:transposase n=1 Tax=Microaerobacter geothermalis TaxID=674972 RepID=UPI001F4209B0|nr:transposase [Microaerobacter geothermalis]MCF6095395.1 transposase [Microaerobacter geothermalis]